MVAGLAIPERFLASRAGPAGSCIDLVSPTEERGEVGGNGNNYWGTAKVNSFVGLDQSKNT